MLKSDTAPEAHKKQLKQSRKRPLAFLLGSALLLGGTYYAMKGFNQRYVPFLEEPAKVGRVSQKDDIEHLVAGNLSANFKGYTAVLSPRPPQVMLFKSNSLVRGIVFKDAEVLKNPRMKVSGNRMAVVADGFFTYVDESGEATRIRIDDIGKLGQKNLDCAFLGNEVYIIGSGESSIIRIEPKSTFTYAHPVGAITEAEGFATFANPSLAAAGERIFVLSDGMKHLYGFDFKRKRVRYETLKSIIGAETAKDMRISNAGERLYLIDDGNQVVYRIDPLEMRLISKFEM